MKCHSYFLSFIILLSSCSYGSSETNGKYNGSEEVSTTSEVQYWKLLDALSHDYVLYYRTAKASKMDVKRWGMPDHESVYIIDSIKYAENYKSFFNQDIRFANWLLTFKNDTIQSGLWVTYMNPMSSYISECNFPQLNNSRAAIILLENFLEGSGFTCFECKYEDGSTCNAEKYKTIEAFLLKHRNSTIPELRIGWQIQKNE